MKSLVKLSTYKRKTKTTITIKMKLTVEQYPSSIRYHIH